MRKIIMLFVVFAFATISVNAQSPEDIMKDRAAKMHETLKTKDIEKFKKFVNENYNERLLKEYEMSFHTGMLERLSKDFSESKIISKKVKDNKLSMVIERIRDKHRVSFEISFDDKDEYKINGIGVEAGEM